MKLLEKPAWWLDGRLALHIDAAVNPAHPRDADRPDQQALAGDEPFPHAGRGERKRIVSCGRGARGDLPRNGSCGKQTDAFRDTVNGSKKPAKVYVVDIALIDANKASSRLDNSIDELERDGFDTARFTRQNRPFPGVGR